MRTAWLLLWPVVLTLPGSAIAEEPAARLDLDKSVQVAGKRLDLGGATLELSNGWLIPVVREGQPGMEWLFSGQGTFSYLPPDPIEASQLKLFTGQLRLEEPVLLVMLNTGDPGEVASLTEGARPGRPDQEGQTLAMTWLRIWDHQARNSLHVDQVPLRMEYTPALMLKYRSAFCLSSEIGLFFFEHDPLDLEQVHLIGPDKGAKAGELPHPIYWTSHGGGNGVGQPFTPDQASDIPHYRINLSISENDLTVTATAYIEMAAPGEPDYALTFSLPEELEVTAVRDREGLDLQWTRSGEQILVAPVLSPDQARVEIAIGYGGEIFDRTGREVPVQKQTLGWYPTMPSAQRATFDITIDRPEEFQLLGGGRLVESEQVDGRIRERRILGTPVLATTFEIGTFDIVEDHVGHIALTVGFNAGSQRVHPKVQQETVTAVKAAILFFEAKFGLLDLDYLTVATFPRDFSQGSLGFVSLSQSIMATDKPLFVSTNPYGTMQEIRLEHIAHEVSHQWWGNKIGWDSYRDQWMSEAMAVFSARQFMRHVVNSEAEYLARRASDSRNSLTNWTSEGRSYESLGPVVLGIRLGRNFPDKDVYRSIIYEKGSVVFSMLARQLDEDPLFMMLAELARAVDHTTISTHTFFKALEKMSGRDLQPFADRYVYGTGREEVYYDYSILEDGHGGWRIEGRAERIDKLHSIIQVSGDGPDEWRLTQVADRSGPPLLNGLIVPFQAGFQADQGTGRIQKGIGGSLTLNAGITRFSIPVAKRPSEFWLDQRGEILAEFICENRKPKMALYRRGRRQEGNQSWQEAEQSYLEALQAPSRVEPAGEGTVPREILDQKEHLENILIHLAIGNLYIDLAREEEALQQWDVVSKLLPRKSEYQNERTALLKSKIDFNNGKYVAVVNRLEKLLLHGSESRRFERWLEDDVGMWEAYQEAYALLTLAAIQAGLDDVAQKALSKAEEFGADMRAVRASQGGKVYLQVLEQGD